MTYKHSPRDLHLSFEDAFPVLAVRRLLAFPRAQGSLKRSLAMNFLSWGCQSSPLRRTSLSRVHSKQALQAAPVFGPGLLRPEHVPSLPFLSASTVYSARRHTGLLHPAAGHGVRRVSGPDGLNSFPLLGKPRRDKGRYRWAPSSLAHHPSKLFPHSQLFRVTAAITLSPFSQSSSSGPLKQPQAVALAYLNTPFESRPQGLAPRMSPL